MRREWVPTVQGQWLFVLAWQELILISNNIVYYIGMLWFSIYVVGSHSSRFEFRRGPIVLWQEMTLHLPFTSQVSTEIGSLAEPGNIGAPWAPCVVDMWAIQIYPLLLSLLSVCLYYIPSILIICLTLICNWQLIVILFLYYLCYMGRMYAYVSSISFFF